METTLKTVNQIIGYKSKIGGIETCLDAFLKSLPTMRKQHEVAFSW